MPGPLSPRKSITSLLFKQYPGQQQVDVACKIEVPGSWFAAGAAGGLSSAERKEKYEAVAMEYENFEFLRPTIAEIVAEYKKVHGSQPPAEELSDDEDQEDQEDQEGQEDQESGLGD